MNPLGPLISWLLGVALGLLLLEFYPRGVDPTYALWLASLGGLALLAAVPRGDRAIGLAGWVMALTLLGMGRALISHQPATPGEIDYYHSSVEATELAALVIGTISAEPQLSDRSQRLRIEVEAARLPGDLVPHKLDGGLLAVVRRYPEYGIGTRVALSGTLGSPPVAPGFDYPAYLARQGIRTYMTFPTVQDLGAAATADPASFVMRSRSQMRDTLQGVLPEPQASLAVGVVTGDRSTLPPQVREDFQRSGTSHILAISGQNIMLLVGVVYVFLDRTGRRLTWRGFALVALALAFYTLFTGATASVVRASAMGAFLLSAPLARRRFDPVAALLVAATLMTALDPDVLFDAGFQLSFAAMVGLSLVAGPLFDGLRALKLPGLAAAPVAASLAVQLTTTPVLLLLGGQVSLVTGPATLTADFALLPLMVTGMLAGALGGVPLLGPILGVAAWPFATWLLTSAEWWSSLPFASLQLESIHPAWLVGYYAALAVAVRALTIHRKRQLRRPAPAGR